MAILRISSLPVPATDPQPKEYVLPLIFRPRDPNGLTQKYRNGQRAFRDGSKVVMSTTRFLWILFLVRRTVPLEN